MERTLYQDGVLVDSVMLNRTETSKAAEILRNRVGWNSRGVATGGVVTANLINSDRVDITAFTGYTPSGEFISGNAAVNQPLSNYTASVMNYVCAIYTETNTNSQPHETDGYSYPTKATASYRLRVFSETDFLALPDSDDNLANDAIDRALVLATVQAEGIGVAITVINLPTDYNNILFTNPILLSTISGITVLGVDSDCPVGTSVLSFDDSAAPNYDFNWHAYGHAFAGAATTITADGIYTLTDNSGTWIKIEVVVSQLPIIGGSTTENIDISNLYEQEIPRVSSEDHLHRNYVGTGIITVKNPHGMSFDDITDGMSGSLQEHQDVQHCNGVWNGSASYLFNGSVSVPHPSDDILSILFPTTNNLYFINGRKLSSLFNNSIEFASATYGVGCDFYEFYVDDDTVFTANKKASYPNPRAVTGTWIVDMSEDHPAGSFNLTCTVAGTDYTFSWNGGRSITIDNSVPPTAAEGEVIRLFGVNATDWIDLYVNRNAVGPVDAQLPALTQTDSVTVFASLDRSQNMQILSAPYWYDGTKGSIGYRTDLTSFPGDAARGLVDKRPRGTLNEENMADQGLEYVAHDPQDELHFSGVLLSRGGPLGEFRLSTAGLVATVRGGSYYCRGKRLNAVQTDLTLLDNKSWLLYADHAGTMRSLNITDDFGGVLLDAMLYVVGDANDLNPYLDDDYLLDRTYLSEKGVPLWYAETSGGGVSANYEIMRNINGPVDPWSVGNRYGGGGVLAAFDNLEAAFLWTTIYANLTSFANGCFEVKVAGPILLDRAVTQPSNVKVTGTKHTSGYINVYALSTTGMWGLSASSVVDGVRIYNTVNTSVCFDILGDDICVQNCYYYEQNNEGCFMFNADQGAVTRYRLSIKDNLIKTGGGVFNTYTYSTIYEDFKFTGNTVIPSDTGNDHNSALPLFCISNVLGGVISSNYFQKVNGTNTTNAMFVYNSLNFAINNNTVFVSEGSSIERGVVVNRSYYFNISNNVVSKRSLGSPSSTDRGIVCIDSAAYNISNNQVLAFNRGILVENDNSYWLYDVGVVNNVIQGNPAAAYNSDYGIKVYYESTVAAGSPENVIFGNLNISGNNISGLKKTSATTNNDVLGIILEVSDVEKYLDNPTNISISNNSIGYFTNTVASGISRGVSIVSVFGNTVASNVFKNVQIDNNSISRFTTVASSDVFAISLDLASVVAGIYYSNISVNGNEIHLTSSNTASSFGGILCIKDGSGFYSDPIIMNSSFDGNQVHISHTSNNYITYSSVGILLGDEIANSSINDNTINAQTCIQISGGILSCTCSNNDLIGAAYGFLGISVSNSIISSNNINVYSLMGTAAVYGVSIVSGSLFTISGCNIRLWDSLGTGAGTLADTSAIINIATLCSGFRVTGCSLYKEYASLSGGTSGAYFLYAGDCFGYNSIDNCHIVLTDTPAVGSHGLFINNTSSNGNFVISNNSILSRHNEDGVTPGGNKFNLFIANYATNGAGAIHVNSVFFKNNFFGIDKNSSWLSGYASGFVPKENAGTNYDPPVDSSTNVMSTNMMEFFLGGLLPANYAVSAW